MAGILDRGLGIFFLRLFLSTWIAQLFVNWQAYVLEQRDYGHHDQ